MNKAPREYSPLEVAPAYHSSPLRRAKSGAVMERHDVYFTLAISSVGERWTSVRPTTCRSGLQTAMDLAGRPAGRPLEKPPTVWW
jgi:hypothetical protein